MRGQSLTCVQLFVTLWTVARQTPLPMGFFRQGYWSWWPFPPPGDLPKPGIEPESFASPASQADSLPLCIEEAQSTAGARAKSVCSRENWAFRIYRLCMSCWAFLTFKAPRSCWCGLSYPPSSLRVQRDQGTEKLHLDVLEGAKSLPWTTGPQGQRPSSPAYL